MLYWNAIINFTENGKKGTMEIRFNHPKAIKLLFYVAHPYATIDYIDYEM